MDLRRGAVSVQQSDELVAKIRASTLLVFDFDGVLADSVEVKTAAFAELYRPYGADVVDRVVSHHRQYGGVSRYEKFRHYHREFIGIAIDTATTTSLADRFSQLVIDKVVASAEIPGVRQFLETYCVDGRRCAINSATPDRELEEIVGRRGLSHFFWKMCGSDRTKTENLDALLASTQTSPAQCVFFGDAVSDLEAARACGVPFVGIGPALLSVRAQRRDTSFPVFADFTSLMGH